jgi:cyanamide hydratase
MDTIHKEIGLKPWAHTTALGEEEFPARIMGNKLMAPYE